METVQTTNERQVIKSNTDRAILERQDQKKKARVTYQEKEIHINNAIKKKIIEVKTWPNKTIERRVVAVYKDGKCIFDKRPVDKRK